MMRDIQYYPLIRIDSEGSELQAMTPTDNEHTIRQNHEMWLSECVENFYRLGARNAPSFDAVNILRVHCPRCGSVLNLISNITKENPFPL